MMARQSWAVTKPQVRGANGIVVAQNAEAAQAGAEVLARGGNAMDAAVVAACVLSVVEPWLSGLGGGGFLLRADTTGATEMLDFNLLSGSGVRTEDYPLVGGAGGDWFNWPAVAGDRNLIGPGSICVPGAVAGFAEALSRYGTLSWPEALAPAIAAAERGMRVDWFADLALAIDADGLRGDVTATALFINGPRIDDSEDRTARRLRMPVKAEMLKRLAEAGPRDFYEGKIAKGLTLDFAAMGAPIAAADLAAYQPEWRDVARAGYRDREICTASGLSGGPSLLAALAHLSEVNLAKLSEAERAAHIADAIRDTYETRLKTMGHAAGPGDCTSHLSVVDASGTMVSLTNTLLSRFGSKVVAPSAGLLMNNGMMWFDPRPDQPNSIAPGVRPLANMAPVIALKDGLPEIGLGAAGGRQIFPAILQILSNLIDLGMSPEAALHAPRLDASTPTVLVNRMAGADVATAISARHPVQITEDTVYPVQFAVPSLVVTGQGGAMGAAHPTSPWATAVAAKVRP